MSKKNLLQKRKPFDPAQMTSFVEATRAVIAHAEGFEGAWVQGLTCWSTRLIGGWTGDDAYATRAVEAHGDTLCIGVEQAGWWIVIEIDEPVGFDPRAVTLEWAKEVRAYTAGTWKPNRGWRSDAVTVARPNPLVQRAI